MLGPLPRLYRLTVFAALLVLCAVFGASLGAEPSIPFLVGTGLVGGAGVGAVFAFAVLHAPQASGARARRRRH